MTTKIHTNGNGKHAPGAPTFTEAPASLNLRFDYKGYTGIMLTLRAGSGLEVLARLDVALTKLDKIGATPAGARAGGLAASQESAPVCKYHGAMKRSKKHGGWFCPAKMGDGSYCKEKQN